MNYEAKFKSLLKQAGFKMDGPYVEIDGHLCAVHVKPLKKRVNISKATQEHKEDAKTHRSKAMLQSVEETVKGDKKPSEIYAEKGFEKTSAAGVLTSLKNKGWIEQNNDGKYFVTKEGKKHC